MSGGIIRQTEDLQLMESRFNAKFFGSPQEFTRKTFTGYGYPTTPVITNNQPDRIQLFHCGLDGPRTRDTMTARIETIKEDTFFKEYIHQKCLIIANGFYQWGGIEGFKNEHKFLISLPKDEPFAIAGLWREWTNGDGSKYGHYTIITTDVNNKPVPVVLKKEIEMDWLMGRTTAKLNKDLQSSVSI